MNNHPLRLLLLEDNLGDRRLVQAKLADGAFGQFVITAVERLADALVRIAAETFDVMLSDLTLPDSTRLDTVKVLVTHAPTLPLVVLTGSNDDAIGNQAIVLGAQDYLIKDEASGAMIARSLRYAMERKKFEQELLHANAMLETKVTQRTQELARSLAELQENLESARALAQTASDAIITSDQSQTILSWNRAAEHIFGFTQEEALGQNLKLIIPERYRDQHMQGMMRSLAGGPRRVLGQAVELHGVRKDGSEFPLELSLSSWSNSKSKMFAAIIRDISERKRMENKLRMLFELSPVGMALVDHATGKFLEVNDSVLRATGYTEDEFLKLDYWQITPQEYEAQELDQIRVLNDTGYFGPNEKEYIRKDGSRYPLSISGAMFTDVDGKSVVWGIVEDISERKQAEEQIRQLAFYDALTELPNRRLLLDRLSQSLAESKRSGRYGALMFLDLDNFKALNDTQGHAVGDLLLMQAAKRMKSCVREVDTVARFGGDEFVVMVGDLNADKATSTAQANNIAEKIRVALAMPYRLTVKHEGQVDAMVEHQCSASIGAVVFIDRDGCQDDFLKWADAAMYTAKEAGGNTIRFSSDGLLAKEMED